MKPREIIAWCLVVVSVLTICALSIILPGQGLTASERKAMDLSDSLNQRLYLNVHATATVNTQFAGTGATASVNGNDAIGQVNITTGSNPKAGSLVHVTFHTPYDPTGVQPIAGVSPLDQPPPPEWYYTIDWYGFDIVVGAAPKPNTNYPFTYIIGPRPWAMYSSPQRLP